MPSRVAEVLAPIGRAVCTLVYVVSENPERPGRGLGKPEGLAYDNNAPFYGIKLGFASQSGVLAASFYVGYGVGLSRQNHLQKIVIHCASFYIIVCRDK